MLLVLHPSQMCTALVVSLQILECSSVLGSLLTGDIQSLTKFVSCIDITQLFGSDAGGPFELGSATPLSW